MERSQFDLFYDISVRLFRRKSAEALDYAIRVVAGTDNDSFDFRFAIADCKEQRVRLAQRRLPRLRDSIPVKSHRQ